MISSSGSKICKKKTAAEGGNQQKEKIALILFCTDFLKTAAAAITGAGTDELQVADPEQAFAVDQAGAFGLHLAKGDFGRMFFDGSDRIRQHSDILSSQKQAQNHILDGCFRQTADNKEIRGFYLAEHPVSPRFLKGIVTANFLDDLVELVKDIARKISISVRGKRDRPVEPGIADFADPIGSGDTAGVRPAVSVEYLDCRNHADMVLACPCHNTADISQNTSVVSNA